MFLSHLKLSALLLKGFHLSLHYYILSICSTPQICNCVLSRMGAFCHACGHLTAVWDFFFPSFQVVCFELRVLELESCIDTWLGYFLFESICIPMWKGCEWGCIRLLFQIESLSWRPVLILWNDHTVYHKLPKNHAGTLVQCNISQKQNLRQIYASNAPRGTSQRSTQLVTPQARSHTITRSLALFY